MLFFLGLFIVGVLVGLYDSVVGSGGIALTAVLSFLNVPPALTIGTMRTVTLIQESVSLVAFLRKKLVEIKLSLFIGLVAAGTSILGAKYVFLVPDYALKIIIVTVMLVLAVLIPLLRIKKKTYRPIYIIKTLYAELIEEDTTVVAISKQRLIILFLSFGLLGLYGGFYGAGFGTIALMLFTYVGRTNLLVGAGNSRMVGFLVSLAAGIIFLNNGAVSWTHFIPLAGGTIIGAWFGVDFADKFGTKYIKLLLTFAVIVISIKLLVGIL